MYTKGAVKNVNHFFTAPFVLDGKSGNKKQETGEPFIWYDT
jgi:hypothetical protein